MGSPNSIDEIFLKASALEGRERRAFLRTLPAELRAKVSALLAADESVVNRGFLGDAFHREEGAARSPESPRRDPRKSSSEGRGNSTGKAKSQRSKPADKMPAPRKRPPSTKRGAPASKKSRGMKRKKNASGSAFPVATIGGVVACVGLVWLIIGTLREEPAATEILPEPEVHDVAAPPELPDEPAEVPVVVDHVVTPLATDIEPVFYTAATSAPPLTQQALSDLPKAMSPTALVTTPQQLPNVRSWTIETIGHRDSVGSMDTSRDGKFFALACLDGNVRIIDSGAGELQKLIAFEDGRPEWVRWGKSSNVMFVGVRNGISRSLVRVDVASGATTHKTPLTDVVFSITADAESLYIHRSNRIHVLSSSDLTSKESVALPIGHTAIRLSADDALIMTSNWRSMAVFRNVRPLELVMEFERDAAQSRSSWSPHGLLATGWEDGMVVVFDPEKTGATPVVQYHAHNSRNGTSYCCGWLNDDIVLVTGSSNQLKLMSVTQKRIVREVQNDSYYTRLCYDSNFRVGVITGGSVRKLNASIIGPEVVKGGISLCTSARYSSNGKQLWVSCGRVKRVQLDSGAVKTFDGSLGQGGTLGDVNFRNDGVSFLARKTKAVMADRNTGDLRTEWDLADHEPLQILSIEDQSRLAVPCKDGTVIICTPFEARLQRLPVDADAKIRTVLWNPSTGTTLLIGQENIFEWDPTDNSVVQIRSHDVAAPRNAVWNPSTTHFAIGGNPVTVLNGRTFESTLTTNTSATELSWLSDDELAMVGDRGNSLTRVKLSQADKPTTVQLQATISGGVFSPTAPVIAGVFHGSQVRFLDRRNGAHLGTFVQFGPYDHAVIAPDGRIVQASPGFRQQIVYQIRTDRGQETLRPAEFFARFGGALSN